MISKQKKPYKYIIITTLLLFLLLQPLTSQLHASNPPTQQTISDISTQTTSHINPKIPLDNNPVINQQNISISTHNINQTHYSIKTYYSFTIYTKNIKINLLENYNTSNKQLTYISSMAPVIMILIRAAGISTFHPSAIN